MNVLEDRLRLRIGVIGLVVLVMMSLLVARLWFLQVLAGDTFAARSQQNYVRLVSEEAPRGRILDRNGVVLVRNRTSLAIGIRKEDFPEDATTANALKRRLSALLDMSVSEIDAKLADKRVNPYKPTAIKEDVSQSVVFTIAERAREFPGVEVVMLPVRTYPRGPLAAHLIGYVGEVNKEELKRSPRAYRLGDSIGRTGLERVYDGVLRGTTGLQKLEVDATGSVLRTLGDEPAKPGNDVQLSLDWEVQKVAEEAVAQGIERARARRFTETGKRFKAPAGAAIVIDPRTGEVIAMASVPTFDLRRFVGGVPPEYYAELTRAGSYEPLYNRAIQAAYPPGSTYKPILATAALASKAVSPSDRFACTTEFAFGDRVFKNWRARKASISLAESLVESCDTVYYQLAKEWWLGEHAIEKKDQNPYEIMQDWSRKFGLGQPTGIDLLGETDGRVPDREYRREVWEANKREYCLRYAQTKERLWEDLCERGYQWVGGYSVNMSIGQGDLLATPMQMAMVYAAIANGGAVLEPHVAKKILRPDGSVVRSIGKSVRSTIDAPASVWRYVRSALRAVTTRGTAKFPYRGWPHASIPVAAKTGSSEVQGKQPFSWFASYAPANDPRYVVVAVIEEAGSGSQVAGPVVRRIMDELFDQPPLPIVYGERSD